MKPFMQHPDNNTSDNGAEDAGIDRGDAQNILYVIGFQHRRIGGRQNAFAVSQKLTARFMTA